MTEIAVVVPEMYDVVRQKDTITVPGVGDIDASFLQINEESLDQDLERQAAYYAYFSVAVANAARDSAMAALNVKVVRADVRSEIREFGKKLTIPDLEAALDVHDRVIEAKVEAIDASHRLAMTNAIMYALQQKKDMLSSKTGLRRTELEVHMKELGAKILTGGTYEK